jgi:hypothetical protein
MKRLPFCVKTLSALALAATLFLPAKALALPGGISADEVGKLLYNFNVIAVPNEWVAPDSLCPNAGHRIFFQYVTSGPVGRILWTVDPLAPQSIRITDCDGTTDDEANVVVNGAGKFIVFVKLLGPLQSSIDLTCIDTDLNLQDLCLVDTVTLTRTGSKDFVKIMADLLADDLENVTWILDNSTGFRILQVRVYQAL